MKYYLGVNCGHNASISIVNENYNLIFSTDIDRFSKISYDFGYYSDQIDRALKYLKIKKNQVVCIAFHQVWLRDEEIFKISKKLLPKELFEKINYLKKIDIKKLNKDKVILVENFKMKGFANSKILICSHHACHAASACFTSPFKKSSVQIFDAYGDNLNESRWKYENFKIYPDLDNQNLSYPNVPHLWEIFSRIVFKQYRKDVSIFLEPFLPSKGPGKIMALASEYKKSNNLVKSITNFGKDLETYKFRISDRRLIHKFKYYFKDSRKYLKKKFKWSEYGIFAASLQFYTNKYVLNKLNYKIKEICFAGGLALNCVSTSFAANKLGIKKIYTPPFPGDSGISVGASYLALEYTHKYSFKNNIQKYFNSQPIFNPYIGYEYIVSFNEIKKYFNKKKFTIKKFNENELADSISSEILKNKIIGLFYNKAEIGPRALCHRSILSNPFDRNNKSKINKIKKREKFRPVAPTLLKSTAKEIFINFFEHSPYMTQVQTLKNNIVKKLPGICHSDNSARPQIVQDEDKNLISKILKKIRLKTGMGIIGNTSFNVEGPIVENPNDAYKLFKSNEIDILVINNFLIKKI